MKKIIITEELAPRGRAFRCAHFFLSFFLTFSLSLSILTTRRIFVRIDASSIACCRPSLAIVVVVIVVVVVVVQHAHCFTVHLWNTVDCRNFLHSLLPQS